MDVLCRIPPPDTENKGKPTKVWAKSVIGVDESKSGGFALLGDFLTVGKTFRLPSGSLVLIHAEWGDDDSQTELLTVLADGALRAELTFTGRGWAKQVLGFLSIKLNLADPDFEVFRYHMRKFLEAVRVRPDFLDIAQVCFEQDGILLEVKR